MRSLPWLFVAACSLPGTATQEQPIIGGTATTDNAAVVLLAGYPANESVLTTCTAVLVAPTVLLTAAHCVDAPNHPDYVFGVFPDADASAYSTLVELAPHLEAVASVHPDPAYDTATPFTADIAAVILAAPLAVTPLPLQQTALDASVVGQPALIVGYGQTVVGTPNQQRFAATTTVAALDTGDTVSVGDAQHHSCLGDSGGPALVNGAVIGLDSYADTQDCTQPAHYRRVDLYLDFIASFTAAGGGDAGTGTDHSGGGCSTTGGGGGLGAAFAVLGLLCSLGRRRGARAKPIRASARWCPRTTA